MAYHPFRTFQKNKVGCMAAVTLLAIVSFILLPAILDLVGGGSGGVAQISTIAESRRFGKITEFELERLRNSQEGLRRFLVVLYRSLDRDLALSGFNDEDRRQALAKLGGRIQRVEQSQHAEALINTWLVTQYVQEEGLLPNWEDVKNLLQELTNGYISDSVFDETLEAVGMSRQTVEQLLSRQIQWDQAEMRFHLSIGAISPATRWDWFQRLYRQVTIEAVAVPTDAFIDQVPEPTERQLNAFFEQHKGTRHNPAIAETGFIMPSELAFQYVVAEPTQKLLDSITEEEMLAFYEENKDELFRRPVRPISEIPGVVPGAGGGALPFPTPGRSSVTPTIPRLSDTDGPGLPDLPGTDVILPEPTPSESEQAEPPISEKTIGDESVPPELAGSEEATEESEGKMETSVMPTVLTRFVSYQTDEGETKQVNEAAAESEFVDLSILFLPFDEVKERIRATLAQEKATAALPTIQERMQEYATIYHEHFEQNKPIPPMPDLSGFVAELGLELVIVPMGNIFAARQSELAKKGFQEEQHLVQMFRSHPLLFGGNIFWGSEGPVLYWVTGEKQELRPDKLSDVRDIVLQRWKEVEARVLAQKKAEELAVEARASGGSLAEVFAGRGDVPPVVDTEPFTWMSYGGIHPSMAMMYRIPPSLGEVRESGVAVGNAEFDNKLIKAPGSGFMETAYALQVGETGVVFNQPRTVAYITRVTSSSPSVDVLWEQFQTTNVRVYLAAGAQEMMETSFDAWLDEIRSKTGFRWVNKPDTRELERFEDF